METTTSIFIIIKLGNYIWDFYLLELYVRRRGIIFDAGKSYYEGLRILRIVAEYVKYVELLVLLYDINYKLPKLLKKTSKIQDP